MTQLFEINGNDAFAYLREGSLTHEVSGIARRATLSCTLQDMPGLDNLQTVEWNDSDGTHFLGFISRIDRKTISKRGQGVEATIACKDIAFRAYDLMISSLHGRRTAFEFSDDVVSDVVGYHWPELDLANVTAHVTVKPKDYTQFTVGDFLDDIAKLAGATWYVTADLELHFEVPAYDAAPWNLSDVPNGTTLFGYTDLELSDEAEELDNRIYTRGVNLAYKNYEDADSVARYGVRYGAINSTDIDTRAEMDAAAAAILAEKAWPSRDGTLDLYVPGLSSGMEVALTALDHELSAAPCYISSVTTKYRQWNSPVYSIKFTGDKSRPIGPEGTPPAESGPDEPSTPSKTLAEELRKKKGTGPGAGSDEPDACCPPPPPFKPKPEDADGSSVQCADEPNFAGGTTATITFDDAPTVGNIIVMWVTAYGNIGAPTIGATVDFAFTGGIDAYGYDAAQYGGPGGHVGIAMYYRVVDGTDTGTYAVSGIPGGADNSHVYMCEFDGISGAPQTWTDEGTMFGGGTYPIGTGLTGFVIGGRAHQRTDYAPADVVTTNGATEHWNADLDGTDYQNPWVVLGYADAPWSTTIAPAAYLDRWGYGAVAFAWAAGETEALVPDEGQDIPWEGAVGDGTTTDHVTNYPYEPGSLIVTANGIDVIPEETDPDAGEFTLPAYTFGVGIAWRYQAQNGIPTGANNAPAVPSTPYIPTATRWELVVTDEELIWVDGEPLYVEVPL